MPVLPLVPVLVRQPRQSLKRSMRLSQVLRRSLNSSLEGLVRWLRCRLVGDKNLGRC